METKDKKIWFPAKRYGWGWGPPVCWQGWVVLITWLGALYLGAYLLRPDKHLAWFIPFVIGMGIILTGICWIKGEKPSWRWGGK
ncbi:MAG TPA: hypothetical protein VH413_19675 [Verrucomicrobiae bacterium]|jgi:hypothetical protein|nr:hypothetical protein [Verrucomicrobiae bacterium]